MIRTPVALLFVAASTSVVHANVPVVSQTAPQAAHIAYCPAWSLQFEQCDDWQVTRGHAYLPPHHIAPEAIDTVVAA